jgi:Zn finger protein HypA/HybF involved in hydrogenase expression
VGNFSENLKNSLDLYFANLTNTQKNKISVDHVSITLGIQYNIAEELLEACCKIKLLKKYPVIVCPFCDGKIMETKFDELYSLLEKRHFCTHCDSEDINCTTDNIFILYKIIKPGLFPGTIQGVMKSG